MAILMVVGVVIEEEVLGWIELVGDVGDGEGRDDEMGVGRG